jgi:hypothetical protein
MNVKVRIRDAEDTSDYELCEWPLDRLEELPETLRAWGVMTEHRGPDESQNTSGEFHVTNGSAYFLLIVHGDDGPR